MHIKINHKGKGEECSGSELLHISDCSKFSVSNFKCVKEHNEEQLSEDKRKHKPAHEPKAQIKLFPNN